MPGTNTRTGSRSYEKPSSFLQPSDPSRFLRTAQEVARQDSLSQSYQGNQNQDTAYLRSKNANIDAANLAEQGKQNDFNRRMQEKEWDAKQASKTITISNPVHKPGIVDPETVRYNRQLQTMREQNQQEMARADRDRQSQQTMQAAQLAAQERLARLQQQTAVLSGNPGESGWRWF